MKAKDPKYPTIEEYYQLQLQPVVSEPYPQRNVNRSGSDRSRQYPRLADVAEPIGGAVSKSTNTLH